MYLFSVEYLILKILMKSSYLKINTLLNHLGQRGSEMTVTESLGNIENSVYLNVLVITKVLFMDAFMALNPFIIK